MLKKIHAVLKTTFAKKKKQQQPHAAIPFLSQLQNPNYWNIVEGQFGEMLIGQDGDIMLEASIWKHIQEKLKWQANKLILAHISKDNSNNLNDKIHNLAMFIELLCTPSLIFSSIGILLKHT